MAKVEAASQGVDNDFNFTGSYDSIALGKIALTDARELMRALPDQDGVSREYLEHQADLCPPALHLTFGKIVKKGLLRKKKVEEPVVLTLVGGHETGKVLVAPFGATSVPKGIVSLSKADAILRDFFDEAAQLPAFPTEL